MKDSPDFDTIAFLQELIQSESCDPPGREIHVARFIKDALDRFGINAEIDEFLPGRSNLIARIKGTGAKQPLVFSAHLDTVPAGRQPWSVPPFSGQISDGRLFGRGASDMKSGVASMTAAAILIAQRREPLAGDLVLAFSAGESSNCIGAKRMVERSDIADASAILVSEPSSLEMITSEMGVLWLRATSKGQLGHVSGAAGVNAIDVMVDFIRSLTAITLPSPDHPLLPEPTLRVGTIAGGTSVNITPDQCDAEIDIRLRPGTDPEEIVALVQTYAPPEISIEISDFKPSVETATDHPFVSVCLDVLRTSSGKDPDISGVAYYSDATIFNEAHGTPFAIIGPGDNGMSGQVDESVDVSNVNKAVGLFRDIAEQWLQ